MWQEPQQNDLTLPEMVGGTLKLLLQNVKEIPSEAMIQMMHLCEIMSDVEDFSWNVIRQFYGMVRQDIELGRYTWADHDIIQNKKIKYVSRAEAISKKPANSNANSYANSARQNQQCASANAYEAKHANVTLICKAYNLGECSAASPHQTPEGNARHSCAFCKKSIDRYFGHPEKYCRRKTEGSSKN
jgi:hypothetical protein